MTEVECRRAADTGADAYRAAFNASVPAEEQALDAEHARCTAIAGAAFDARALGHEEPRRANEARMRQALEASFAALRAERLATAAAGCERMLREAADQLGQVRAGKVVCAGVRE